MVQTRLSRTTLTAVRGKCNLDGLLARYAFGFIRILVTTVVLPKTPFGFCEHICIAPNTEPLLRIGFRHRVYGR